MKEHEHLDDAQVMQKIHHYLMRRAARRQPGAPPRPIPSIAIARLFGIREHGSTDSRKRGVRTIIDVMRKDGIPVLSNFRGYYLAADAADHAEWRQFRHRMGLAHLAAESVDRHAPATLDADGQYGLFGRRTG